MTTPSELFDSLARLYVYPDEAFAALIDHCRDLVEARWPGHSDGLMPLAERARTMSLGEAEELFTQAFDFNPATALEIGWHIYGEDYARGELLVRLRGELRRAGVAEDVELPDHLTHLLRLITRLDRSAADDLVGRYLLSALSKIETGLGEDTPYRPLVSLTRTLLELEHPEAELMPVPERTEKRPPGSKHRLPVVHHPHSRPAASPAVRRASETEADSGAH